MVDIGDDEEGVVATGAITAIDLEAGTATVEDDEHIYEEIALADLSPAEQQPETEEPESDDEMAALVEFCESTGLDEQDPAFEGCESTEDIVTLLGAYEWKASDLTAEEVTLLESHGVAVAKPAPKPKPKAKPKPKPKAKPKATRRTRKK